MSWLATRLPHALIRLLPDRFEVLEQFQRQIPGVRVALEAEAAAGVKRIGQLAVNVELQLLVRRIADPHRATTFVAGQPRDFVFGQPALAGETVHDLHFRGMPGRGPQQPLPPGAGFASISGAQQRIKRQGRIADPAVAVIPVAHAADPFRQ